MIGLLKDLKADSDRWKGRRVLFLHTGGLLSMFEKSDQLQPLVMSKQPVSRLRVSE